MVVRELCAVGGYKAPRCRLGDSSSWLPRRWLRGGLLRAASATAKLPSVGAVSAAIYVGSTGSSSATRQRLPRRRDLRELLRRAGGELRAVGLTGVRVAQRARGSSATGRRFSSRAARRAFCGAFRHEPGGAFPASSGTAPTIDGVHGRSVTCGDGLVGRPRGGRLERLRCTVREGSGGGRKRLFPSGKNRTGASPTRKRGTARPKGYRPRPAVPPKEGRPAAVMGTPRSKFREKRDIYYRLAKEQGWRARR
ncbi:MAG: hypothetical protein BJ554DRAFT_638 [Olpidium bornovanus]|uniref:Uncharacterized protein n=1 Tax=Olpidium bornovanus TaxID=278681 RepID=A0A8H7ZT92_9FUNG|nr:MAG: hypothetical protein BJ554DRAFT_638 [Olpidium bornovanus]